MSYMSSYTAQLRVDPEEIQGDVSRNTCRLTDITTMFSIMQKQAKQGRGASKIDCGYFPKTFPSSYILSSVCQCSSPSWLARV